MAAPDISIEPGGISTPLSLLWQTPGTASTAQLPLSANGSVYYAAGRVLHAVRGSDGASLWTYEGEANFTSAPALCGGSLYIGDGAGITRVDLKNGSLIWKKALGSPVHSTPISADGKLYFGSDDGRVYAMDPISDDLVWTFKASSPVMAQLAVCDNGDLLAASEDNSLYCLSGTTGRRKWRTSLPAVLTSPAYSSGVCYIGAGSDFYGIDSGSGTIRLKVHLDAGITSAPAVSDTGIFITTDDHRCRALSSRGSQIWTADIGDNSAVPVLPAGKSVVVSTQHGVIFAYDSQTGKLLWNYVVQPKALSGQMSVPVSQIYVGSTLYVLAGDGGLSAFEAQASDKDSPIVADMLPSSGTPVSGAQVPFAATVADQGSGISPATVSFTVDGVALDSVRYFAAWNGVRVSANPDAASIQKPLTDGVHTATLKATDWKGNTVTKTWNFTVDSKIAAVPAPDSHTKPLSSAYSSDPWTDPNYPYPKPSPDGDNRLQRQQALQIYQTLMREYQQNGGPQPPLPPSY